MGKVVTKKAPSRELFLSGRLVRATLSVLCALGIDKAPCIQALPQMIYLYLKWLLSMCLNIILRNWLQHYCVLTMRMLGLGWALSRLDVDVNYSENLRVLFGAGAYQLFQRTLCHFYLEHKTYTWFSLTQKRARLRGLSTCFVKWYLTFRSYTANKLHDQEWGIDTHLP